MTETRSLLLLFKHSIFVLLGLVLALSAHATTEDTQTKTRSNPVIAKPEAFKVQRQSGGLAYQYEIELPEAAGIAPRLKLSFNSLNGNGEVGRGWALNSSHIERSTRKGLPTYAAPASGLDTFELEGSLLVPDPSDANRFHLQQNDHRRILYRPGSDSWEVTDTDGTRYLYGSRSEAQSTIRNYGRQPELPLGTFRWSLDTVIDPRGNWYEIDYESETYSHRQASGGTIKYTMNNHLHQIRYSFHSSESSNRKRRIVDFQWGMRGEGEHNDDRPTSYRSGFKIQISQRLTDIIVGTDSEGDNQIDARIARYELRYDPKPSWNPSWDGTPGEPGDPMLPIFSRLSEIQRYGATDADVFPGSMKFNYKRPDHTVSSNGEFGRGWQEDYQTHSSWSGFIGRGRKPPSGLDILSGPDFQPWGSTYPNYESQIEFLDMDNDGLVDRVYVDEEGRWTSQKLHARTESASPGFQADQAWYWHCGDGGSLSETCPGWSSNIKYRHPYSSNSDTFDINGDGLPDHVVASNTGSGYEWHVFKNLGRSCGGTGDTWYAGCFAPVEIWAAPGPIHDIEYTVNMAKPNPLRGTLVDVNGDGLPDYVSGHNGGEWFEDTHGSNHLAWVSINTGSGFMEPEVYSAVFSRDSASEDRGNYFGFKFYDIQFNFRDFQVTQIFADANGDGLADRLSLGFCIDQPSMSFSMGDGWQTEDGAGQKHWDFPESCQTSDLPNRRGFLTGVNKPKFTPEAGSSRGTHTAMLDFNGDGINDLYHYGHEGQVERGEVYAPAVW